MPPPLGEMIRNEVGALQRVAAHARRAASLAWQRAEDQDLLWGFVALNLADFYAGVQRMLRRVAEAVDGEVPGGPHADAELLRQILLERPGVRPAVLSRETVEALEEFRHVWRLVVDGRSSELAAPRLAAPLRRWKESSGACGTNSCGLSSSWSKRDTSLKSRLGQATGRRLAGPATDWINVR